MARPHLDRNRVEERSLLDGPAECPQSVGQYLSGAMHFARDVPKTVRTVIDRIHRRDHRRKDLRGTDIGSRLLAADVLLARLQSESVGWLTAGIDRYADDAAGKRALVGILGCNKGGVRPPIAHRHAKALSRSDRDVRTQFARRSNQSQRKRIGCHDSERAGRVQC